MVNTKHCWMLSRDGRTEHTNIVQVLKAGKAKVYNKGWASKVHFREEPYFGQLLLVFTKQFNTDTNSNGNKSRK